MPGFVFNVVNAYERSFECLGYWGAKPDPTKPDPTAELANRERPPGPRSELESTIGPMIGPVSDGGGAAVARVRAGQGGSQGAATAARARAASRARFFSPASRDPRGRRVVGADLGARELPVVDRLLRSSGGHMAATQLKRTSLSSRTLRCSALFFARKSR